MRWLGALAVLLIGAAIYLHSQLSDGSTKAAARSAEPAATAATETDAATASLSPAPSPQTPSRPAIAARPEPKWAPSATTSPPPRIEDTPTAPADAGDPNVPWTEAERQQWLWTANGRFEKGNYPRALEASLEIARRNPGSAWEQDAWGVAVKSYCAMSEPEKANALFSKMTDQTGIDAALKTCTEWNVKLAK